MTESPIQLILSVTSFCFTAWFWFVKARRERPGLVVHQIAGFRAVCRRHPQKDDCKRLCVQQISSHGVLVANNSIRQTSIVLFDCWLLLPDGAQVRGDWGTVGDDMPPWNIGPESAISLGMACFFDVPEDFEIPESFRLGIEFVTAAGNRFPHVLSHEMPATAAETEERFLAA